MDHLGFVALLLIEGMMLFVCVTSATRIPTHYAVVGRSTTLMCESRSHVNCAWSFNKTTIRLTRGSNYEYQSSGGTKTRDCTMKIAKLGERDLGHWECWSTATHEHNELKLKECLVYEMANPDLPNNNLSNPANLIKIVVNPESAVSNDKQRISLKCIFDKPVTCIWKRNGKRVKIASSYNWLSGDSSPRVDCGIKFISVSDIDLANWICSSEASDESRTVKSEVARIEKEIKTDITLVLFTIGCIAILSINIIIIIIFYKRKTKKCQQ